MASYIKEVAKLFGVKEGEAFQVDGDISLNNYIFKFAVGFLQISKKDDAWTVADDSILTGLLYGHLSIRKPLWKPAFWEKYYIPAIGHKGLPFLWTPILWSDAEFDNKLYEQGIVCKTKEEAEELAKKILAFVKKVRNDE